ncbi:MAG: hypothetical protein BEN19_01855 [Epulopiscium sp. Nuni2H_MBin003]|nr:MAG: hypothetical protein BEN19_01855 [Epulopiscium sp. Nuni2H_MBin003]
MCNKQYNYTYPTVLCTNTRLSDNINKKVDFEQGIYYPFSCISFELTEQIDPSRVVQIISESGYKISLKDKELLNYFDITSIIINKFSLIKRV